MFGPLRALTLILLVAGLTSSACETADAEPLTGADPTDSAGDSGDTGKTVDILTPPDVPDTSDADDTFEASPLDAEVIDAIGACGEQYVGFWEPQYDDECSGNTGCTDMGVECGECVCGMCEEDRCVVVICDDGGSPDCPGSPWDDVDAGAEDSGASD